MKCNIEFVVNSRIEIEIDGKIYKSNIQDISEDYIGINIPVNNHKYIVLKKGDKIAAVYYLGKNIYRFNTVVIGRKIEKILIIMIKKPEEVEVVQRRNFVRVPLVLNVLCAVVPVNKDPHNLDEQVEVFNAHSLDLSGGGMKISVDDKLKCKVSAGDIIMVTIPMEDDSLAVKGKVVRISRNNDKSKIIFGLNFVDLDKINRERIVKLLFQVMRKHIEKGAKED
ncbi:flagellar brake protein [Clostridium luticellarii]|uniref:flagellar brake protein n=1 Tax=Clostridium luticellarii TaxID=1691940 RepID=UPI00235762F0|nr:flagellar brake domain-containing protein [Clostridium luticellarii]MCI1943689.1 PilZ domain-containing protein [Clostridium luticellarii]MCI1968940.1 PilZ domain-containing protein [Clostridium luticellarii]MCI1994317.1 PilZ domain-containing protein [Clostridium luticellarii]MCI2038730.1 PilZ domain-containing protein [Clostridium luticellarii]